MAPGYYQLPTLRRVTENGWSHAIPIEQATDDEIRSLMLDTLKFRANVLDTIADQAAALSAEMTSRINAREVA